MFFRKLFTILFLVNSVNSLDSNLLHKPYGWHSDTSQDSLGFNYANSGQAIQTSNWLLGGVASNKSSGVDLMATSPSSNQAFIEWTGKTTTSEWRSELELSLGFDATTAAGNCPMFGYILHPGSMTINSDNTIPNFKGLAVWLKFCENDGGILGHFTTSNLASYDPYALSFGSTCDSCSFGSSVPATVELAIQIVDDRLQVAMRVPGMIASMCVNYADVTGFKTYVTSTPLSIYFAGVNGNYGNVEVISHEFSQLGEDTAKCKLHIKMVVDFYCWYFQGTTLATTMERTCCCLEQLAAMEKRCTLMKRFRSTATTISITK